MLVKVDKLVFPADFIIMDFDADENTPIILGRPFLATGRTLIDVEKGELTMRVNGQQVVFNVLNALQYPDEDVADCSLISSWEGIIHKTMLKSSNVLTQELGKLEKEDISQEIAYGPVDKPSSEEKFKEVLELSAEEKKQLSPSIEVPPDLELKQFPAHLQYAFLEAGQKLPVIVATDLAEEQRGQLLEVLKKHRRAIAWQISDIKGISPTICMHRILLEENAKNSIESQRRLNPIMKEVVKKEIIKWLDAGIIYPIYDNVWVSPIQCVPKKGGMTVVSNEKDELISTRTITGWRICMDYRKLNKATRKDHFPLPFID